MARRDFRTPPTLPETNITRCVVIPASQEWLGLMNAALLFLTEAWRYEQVEDTDLTAAETAAKWYEIYVQYLTGECEGVGCCTELRTDPNTGRLQYTEDGGLTWFDVAEGPWIDAPNVASADAPPPLNQGTDAADRCLAAWNAADVIAEFYRQTAGAAAAGLYNTLLSMNMFLNELNNALLEIAYPQAGRLLNASGFLDFDWGEYAAAPTLDSTAMDALRCLLYCNASVTGGIVSFDHGAVYDNLIADLGINPGTAVTLLVGYMGEAGLNHAGGILANETAECECAACPDGTWCYAFDMNELPTGFSVIYGDLSGTDLVAEWLGPPAISQVNWVADLPVGTAVTQIYWTFANQTAEGYKDTLIVNRTFGNSTNFGTTGPTPATFGIASHAPSTPWTEGFTAEFYVATDNGYAAQRRIQLEGTGPNPFGEDNCSE